MLVLCLELELSHFPEEGTKDPSSFNRQYTRDVFPDEASRFFVSEDFDEFKGKVSFLGFQTLSFTCLGEILARGPAHQQVDLGVHERPVVWEPRHVPKVRNVRIAVLQDPLGNGRISENHAGFQPSASQATVAAPIPLHTHP
jgi:hypothetical protein